MSSLPKLDYAHLAPTRNYLQEIAKVIGKTQQQFLPADQNAQDKGLLVTSNGLSTQDLEGQQFILDFYKGEVRGFGSKWQLGEVEPAQLLKEVRDVTGKPVVTPETGNLTLAYEQRQAVYLAEAFEFAAQELAILAHKINTGVKSLVLVYPHHFDVSLAWYTHRLTADETDERQYTFGFSTGDEDIAQPYFYATAYPEPENYKNIQLEAPAYWQNQGFSGAILNYGDVVAGRAAKLVNNFYASIVDSQIKFQIL